jgi:glycolate oxidase
MLSRLVRPTGLAADSSDAASSDTSSSAPPAQGAPGDLRRVSASVAERALVELSRALGSRVSDDRTLRERYTRDESEATAEPPHGVVFASSADDIATTLRIAQAFEIPVTPRAGGTGKTGGAVPVCGGVVLVTEGLRRIKEIDVRDLVAVVEPGVVLADLHAACEGEGLFYPPDPSSLATCCLGGNIAENAGGPRAVKYGVTRDYVLGLETVLMGGERLSVGRRTTKGVTGYDLTSLLVGSEGTLGVFTEATLRLVPLPEATSTLVAMFSSARAAGEAVSAMIAARVVPRCIELLDEHTLEALRLRGIALPIDEAACALLLIEVDGHEQAVEVDRERVGEACTKAGALSVLVAQDAAQRDRLWSARREMSPSLRRLARFKLSEDVVVPRSQIPRLLEEVRRISERERVRMPAYGHAGDGNFHVNFLWDDPDDLVRVDAAIEALFHTTIALRGTLSGEHGIGILKAPYLSLEQSPGLIALQQRTKAAFDPRGLLNPGKIFAGEGHRSC